MNLPFVLYLAYHGLAVGLCLWAVATALPRVEEHGIGHRAWTLVTGLGMPLALAAAAFAAPLGHPELRPFGALLPVLATACCWSNVMTLRDQSLGLKLVAAPVLLWNAALAGIYTLRVIQDLTGMDLGTTGTTLAAGHAMLQTQVGAPDAMSRPVFLHLPLLLPLCLRYEWHHRITLLLSGGVATAMLAGLALTMPLATERARDFRIEGPGIDIDAVALGVAVPWSERRVSADKCLDCRADWLGIRADILSVDVDVDLFEDTPRFERVRGEIENAQREGRTVVAIARPTRQMLRRPAADLESYATQLAKTHWLAAEQLHPDVLVLHAGPFGRSKAYRDELGTIDAWFDRIARDVADVRRVNTEVRLTVSIESRAPHAARLFKRLCADDSPLQMLGLSINIDRCTPRELNEALETWSTWLLEAPGTKPAWILDSRVSAITSGGEVGQWNLLGRLRSFAARHARIEALIVDNLIDRGYGDGLITPDGRYRLAYRKLRDLALEAAAPR